MQRTIERLMEQSGASKRLTEFTVNQIGMAIGYTWAYSATQFIEGYDPRDIPCVDTLTDKVMGMLGWKKVEVDESPKAITEPELIDYDTAVTALEDGKFLARKVWPPRNYVVKEEIPKQVGNNRLFIPAIVIYLDNGMRQAGWLPTEADKVAEDWLVL